MLRKMRNIEWFENYEQIPVYGSRMKTGYWQHDQVVRNFNCSILNNHCLNC